MNWWVYGVTPQKFFYDESSSWKVNQEFQLLDQHTWRVTGNYSNININDFLVIKSGYDKRSVSLLDKHKVQKLERGIYAIARITGKFISEEEKFISFQVESNFYGRPVNDQELMEYSFMGRIKNIRKLEDEALSSFEKILKKEYDVDFKATYSEGTQSSIITSRYERNSFARDKCLSVYGYTCKVCEMDFEKKYGEIGKNYIHVHHKIPISQIKESYIIDPVEDLIPVCPNCHYMLHRRKPLPFSPEEFEDFI